MVFSIMFESKTNHQWSCEYIFKSFDDAKQYLFDNGFTEKNRMFYRENYNWSVYIKAYISSKKIWAK